jgi:hypothetical protein
MCSQISDTTGRNQNNDETHKNNWRVEEAHSCGCDDVGGHGPFLQKEIPAERSRIGNVLNFFSILVPLTTNYELSFTAMPRISKRAPSSSGPEPMNARAGKGGRKYVR